MKIHRVSFKNYYTAHNKILDIKYLDILILTSKKKYTTCNKILDINYLDNLILSLKEITSHVITRYRMQQLLTVNAIVLNRVCNSY